MSRLNETVASNWKVNDTNVFDVSFMRICANDLTREFEIENEINAKNVTVMTSYDGNDRIVSLYFEDYQDENYLQMKLSIQDAKDFYPTDYEAKYNRYIFHVEFESDEEIACGGDISVSKNMCHVDESNNAIIFVSVI